MSMLAERRSKQKWTLNPRGNDWAQDDNKLGQRLLEKMGWTKGKGLGLKEDGNPDHVKVSAKSNAFGLGYQENQEAWTQHEDSFSSFLESLSNINDEQIVRTNETNTSRSLEEKSKQSRARVHYSKFTRGKDISRYSAKDLANIFGKTHIELPTQSNAIEETETVSQCDTTEVTVKKKKRKKSRSAFKENTSPQNETAVTDCVVVLNRIDETKYSSKTTTKKRKNKKSKEKSSCFLANILKRKKSKKVPASGCAKEPAVNLMGIENLAFNPIACGSTRMDYDNLALDPSDESTGKRKSHVIEDMEVIRADEPRKKKRKSRGIDNPSLDITPEPDITEGFDNPCLDVSPETSPKPKKQKVKKTQVEPVDLDPSTRKSALKKPERSESQTKKRVRFARIISVKRYEKSSSIALPSPFEVAIDNAQSEIENSINETKSVIEPNRRDLKNELLKTLSEDPDVIQFPGIALAETIIGYGQTENV